MKLRKRERALTGVFVAAIAALAVDRLFLSGTGPASVLADESSSDVPAAPGVDATLVHAPTSQPAVPETVPDVFHWSRLGIAAAAMSATPAPNASAEATAREFETNHQLTAVILGPRPLALVGGATLRVGDQLDGFTLRDVQFGAAQFVSDGQIATLRLPPMGKPR